MLEVAFFFLVFIIIGVTGTIGLKQFPDRLARVKRTFSRDDKNHDR